MSWKDNLRPASFRGVPFFIDTSNMTTGRNVALHEYLNRTEPYPEDMGQVPRNFRIDGHILGDDYFQTKDRLIRAAEQQGPGELIHPYFGTMQVQIGAFSVGEDNKTGRIASISFQFYEAGTNVFPDNLQDKEEIIFERSDALLDASKKEFDDKFSVADQPAFVVDSARLKVETLSALFESSTEGLVTGANKASELAFNSRNLIAESTDLLSAPSELSQRIIDSFVLLQDTLLDIVGRNSAINNFTNFGSEDDEILTLTPQREQQDINLNTFNDFIIQISIAKAIEYAAGAEFDNLEDANNRRLEISSLIDSQREKTNNDDIYQALQSLRDSLVRSVPDTDADIPNIETINTNRTTNSLLVVYDAFENIDSEADLIKRNKISNPAIIAGGTELEVIDVRKQ